MEKTTLDRRKTICIVFIFQIFIHVSTFLCYRSMIRTLHISMFWIVFSDNFNAWYELSYCNENTTTPNDVCRNIYDSNQLVILSISLLHFSSIRLRNHLSTIVYMALNTIACKYCRKKLYFNVINKYRLIPLNLSTLANIIQSLPYELILL